MGTTTSRPILYGIEAFLLQIARIIDTGIRFVERLLSSLYSLCLPASLYRNFDGNGAPVRACDERGVCYVPATRLKQHQKMKQQRDDRLKRRKIRAEWAAAGLDVDEMEKQEMIKKKRQQQQQPASNRTSTDMDAYRHDAQISLGSVARAPPARPEQERETRAERERGRLWVMGNIAPPQTRTFGEKTSTDEWTAPLESLHPPLESVRETSHQDLAEYAIHGHGNRLTSGTSEHGDISYQIVATSDEIAHRTKSSPLRPTRAHDSKTAQRIVPAQAPAVAVATSASRLGVASHRPSHKANASSLPTLPFLPSNSSTGPTTSPPMLVMPAAQRLRQSLDLSPSSSRDVRAIAGEKVRKDPIDLRSDSPRFFNRARASLDLATTTAASQVSRPSSPGSPAGVMSSASSDAGSITSKRSLFGANISRSSTPPCVSDLANRACKSRWEATAKERKGWRGEIDAMTLHRLHQASRRSRQEAQMTKKGGGGGSPAGATVGIAGIESRLRSSVSDASDVTNLALVAEKKLKRASMEAKQTLTTTMTGTIHHNKTNAKNKRRSSQKT